MNVHTFFWFLLLFIFIEPTNGHAEFLLSNEAIFDAPSGRKNSNSDTNLDAIYEDDGDDIHQDDNNLRDVKKDNKSVSVGTFDILEFNVIGNTLLPKRHIEQAVYPYLGESLTINDAEAARTALEKAYHEAGYVSALVNIPEQKVTSGIVRLEVIESPVDKLRVSGARYTTLRRIKSIIPELQEGKIPHFPTVQKQLTTLNRSGDRRVTPVLKAGKTPGTLSVELKVDDKLPLHGSVSLNDRYSADTTQWRSTFNMHYDNLWQLDHSLNLSLTISPEKLNETMVIAATYSVPLDSGDNLALYAVHSKSDVSVINTLNVLGNGQIFGLRYIHPIPGMDSFYQNVTLGVDYKDFGQTVNLLGGDSFNTPISYLPFMVNWDGVLNTKFSVSKLGINLNTHFRDLVGQEGEFANKRFKAHANYLSFRVNAEQAWNFESGIKLSMRLNGQWAEQALISNEQFAIGGLDTVRGYLESEVLGDKGYVANLEVHTPSIGSRVSDKFRDLHALAFIDYGEVSTINPLASQRANASLSSAGFGIVANFYGLNGVFHYAKAFKDGASGRTISGDERWHIGFEYPF